MYDFDTKGLHKDIFLEADKRCNILEGNSGDNVVKNKQPQSGKGNSFNDWDDGIKRMKLKKKMWNAPRRLDGFMVKVKLECHTTLKDLSRLKELTDSMEAKELVLTMEDSKYAKQSRL